MPKKLAKNAGVAGSFGAVVLSSSQMEGERSVAIFCALTGEELRAVTMSQEAIDSSAHQSQKDYSQDDAGIPLCLVTAIKLKHRCYTRIKPALKLKPAGSSSQWQLNTGPAGKAAAGP